MACLYNPPHYWLSSACLFGSFPGLCSILRIFRAKIHPNLNYPFLANENSDLVDHKYLLLTSVLTNSEQPNKFPVLKG